ncbi:hypothetical protein RN001_007796 [Aquatica leii]|uniref:Uncharacterized protein n=1 Tax=Aquatica leii TaxID=1421715 RepID=A0AAN7Q4L7_9COLE|nr:hypothetical protein RN001_007796 [Aquatica leii]
MGHLQNRMMKSRSLNKKTKNEFCHLLMKIAYQHHRPMKLRAFKSHGKYIPCTLRTQNEDGIDGFYEKLANS